MRKDVGWWAACELAVLGPLLALAVPAPLRAEESAADRQSVLIAAIGDAGTANKWLKKNGQTMSRLYLGSSRRLNALLFLGDNFYEAGLSGADWQKTARSVLDPFASLSGHLTRANVHAIAGNHDYYTKRVNLLLARFPAGFSSVGNERAATLPDWTYHYDLPQSKAYRLEDGQEVLLVFFDSAQPLRKPVAEWEPAFVKLTELLAESTRSRSIRWRVLVAHHPMYSAGEHGQHGGAVGWFMSKVDPENLYDAKYKAYRRRLRSAIAASGANVQVLLAGHDHDLQLLWNPEDVGECAGCPAVHIVSGAGAKLRSVAPSYPPYRFTAPATLRNAPPPARTEATASECSYRRLPDRRAESKSGFVEMRFESSRLRVAFCDGSSGEAINMAEGHNCGARAFFVPAERGLTWESEAGDACGGD